MELHDKHYCHKCHKPKPKLPQQYVKPTHGTAPERPVGSVVVEELPDGTLRYRGHGRKGRVLAKKYNAQQAQSHQQPPSSPKTAKSEDVAQAEKLRQLIALAKECGQSTTDFEGKLAQLEAKTSKPDTPASCASKLRRAKEIFEKVHGQYTKTLSLLDEQRQKVQAAADEMERLELLNREVLAKATADAMGQVPQAKGDIAISVPDLVNGKLPRFDFGGTFDGSGV